MKVRMATPEDVRSIAEIHVAAWRAAYRDLMPQAFLDQVSVDKRGTPLHEIRYRMRVKPGRTDRVYDQPAADGILAREIVTSIFEGSG